MSIKFRPTGDVVSFEHAKRLNILNDIIKDIPDPFGNKGFIIGKYMMGQTEISNHKEMFAILLMFLNRYHPKDDETFMTIFNNFIETKKDLVYPDDVDEHAKINTDAFHEFISIYEKSLIK